MGERFERRPVQLPRLCRKTKTLRAHQDRHYLLRLRILGALQDLPEGHFLLFQEKAFSCFFHYSGHLFASMSVFYRLCESPLIGGLRTELFLTVSAHSGETALEPFRFQGKNGTARLFETGCSIQRYFLKGSSAISFPFASTLTRQGIRRVSRLREGTAFTWKGGELNVQ